MESGAAVEPADDRVAADARPDSARDDGPPQSNGRRNVLVGLVAYVIATIVLISFTGVLLARETIFLWLLVGLLVVSLTDVRGFARGIIVDWLPFYVTLVAYDFLRGYVGNHPFFDPHFLPQIHFDEFLFGGTVPTITLQERFFEVGQLPWYDLLSWAVYLTHFFLVFVIAAVLWRVARQRFLEWRAMVVTLSMAAFLTYAFFPAAPPWMAADYLYIDPPVYRLTGNVWTELGVHPAAAIWDKGDSLYNPVAALPSLHAAFPMLLLCFFWKDGWLLRLTCGAYVIAMGWTLVYGGEHFVFDVFLGWAYAVAVYFGVRWVRARWARRRERSDAELLGVPNPP